MIADCWIVLFFALYTDEVIGIARIGGFSTAHILRDKFLNEDVVVKVETQNSPHARETFEIEEGFLRHLAKSKDSDQYAVQLYDSFTYNGK